MIEKEIKLPPRANYPIEPWRFVQKQISDDLLGRDEAIFTVSNGYFGIRGCFEEGDPVLQKGTYIHGFHETWPIPYAEDAYGLARTGQTMLTVPDASQIRLFVDDEPFSLAHAYLLNFERALDMKNGLLTRDLVWDTASGKQIRIQSERIVSFPERHVAAIKYSVTVLNSDAHLAMISELTCAEESQETSSGDPRKSPKLHHRVFNPRLNRAEQQRILLGYEIENSGMKIVCGVDHKLITRDHLTISRHHDEDHGRVSYTIEAKENQPVTLVKFITYHTSSPRPEIEDLADRADRSLDRAMSNGFDHLKKIQREYLDEYWKNGDVQIVHKEPHVNQIMRLHVYHLLQASARVQNSGIGAKGLTGSGYEGHSFWDIEIYMLPFLIYNLPRVAKNLLIYRYKMLDIARKRAEELNQKGALFPWRTINGEEASAFFLAGTAQYHINADIAFAVKKYCDITKDQAFLYEYGAEILVETARLWADLGFYDQEGNFQIHGVTGPDEYNTMVNNNTYTNLMARENLRYASKIVTEIRFENPRQYKVLAHKTNLQDEEIEEWHRAAVKMYIPYNEKLGINPQDDTFLKKEVLDLKSLPKDKFPLLLHFHPLVLYRFQVIKQADVALALFLLGNAFTKDLKKRNFDYYDPLTTGDSSLSVSIQGIMAAELGYTDLATKYFSYALFMDIGNLGGNVDHGLHLASMGGIWMCATYGAAGMRDYEGQLSFDPRLINDTKLICFRLRIRNSLLEVNIKQSATTYKLIEGDELSFLHREEEVTLKKGEQVKLK